MKAVQFLKWSSVAVAGVFVISSLKGPEYHKPIKFNPDYLKSHKWISVNEQGKPRTSNHQTCKLIFLENQDFELRKTFEYSGSTFRTPGKYFMQDSFIKLKNLTGTQTLGKAYIFEDHHLRIEWKNCNAIYGEGMEMFRIEQACRKNSNNFQFSAEMPNLFNFN